MTPLDGWENFYVIVGSSAGALIGLQFVVITLIAEQPITREVAQAGATFTTPSVVHFGVVLFLSAVAAAPWDGIGLIAVLWALTGLCGMGYVALVARGMRKQTGYRPVFEDQLFHVLLPMAVYGLFAVSAVVACWHVRAAEFLAGAAGLLLLLAGIHNAWDNVTYNVFVKRRVQRDAGRDQDSGR